MTLISASATPHCRVVFFSNDKELDVWFVYTVQKWKRILLLLLLFYFGNKTLYGTVLQHDNARPHAACNTTQFPANNNVQVLPCLSMSPDLNANKHTKNELERRVRGRVNAPANVRELFQALQQAWVAIQARVIHNLKQSMPYKC